MVQKETWQGIAVAGAIVAAMIGVFFWAAANFGEYPVTYGQAQADAQSTTGSLNEGANAAWIVNMTHVNVTRVYVNLTWTDDVGAADTFRIEVAPPMEGALPIFAEESDGAIMLVYEVGPAPNETTVPARNPEHGQQQMDVAPGSMVGVGDWTVTVTLVTAPGQADDGIPPAEPTDGSNDYAVTFDVVSYRAVVGQTKL